jgi:hypothetical protein
MFGLVFPQLTNAGKVQDAGYRIHDAENRMQDAGYTIHDEG